MRLGFCTAPKPILDRMDLIRANTVLQVASTTQGLAYALFNHWGHDEFLNHCKRVSKFYEVQRDMFEVAAKKHLDGLATWVTPMAGMVSLKLLVSLCMAVQRLINLLVLVSELELGR